MGFYVGGGIEGIVIVMLFIMMQTMKRVGVTRWTKKTILILCSERP